MIRPSNPASRLKSLPRVNPFTGRFGNANWIVPVTGLSLVLGFMVATTWVTEATRSGRASFLQADQRARVDSGEVDRQKFASLQLEVTKLRRESSKLQNVVASGSPGEKTLNDSLQEAKVYAGLTPVEGPGVVVTLTDKPSEGKTRPLAQGFIEANPDDAIHDLDLIRVVNEFYASGAEAVAVNGYRLSSASWIRCAGPTILVDSNRLASPFKVEGIGDVKTLLGGLNLPGGIISEIRQNTASMVKVQESPKLRLPAYSGPTGRKLLRVPKEAK